MADDHPVSPEEFVRLGSQSKEKEKDGKKLSGAGELLSQQYLSLATLYYSRRKLTEALELLELSKYKSENVSKTRFLLGKIHLEKGEIDKALEEFVKARELDPFYEDICKHLGKVLFEQKKYDLATEAYMDAYVLCGGEDAAKTSFYQHQIRKLFELMNVDDGRTLFNELFAARKEHFLNLANSLSVPKDGKEQEGLEPILFRAGEADRGSRSSLDLALELKKFPVLQGLSDEELLAVARITRPRQVDDDKVIFRENDRTEGIYFIQSGSIRIVKPTPFGEQLLASLGTGEFFGEMDLIDSLRCSADAIADEDTALLSISKAKLEEIFVSQKHIAVQFYWHFWKTLSQRIRQANELLKSFFLEANRPEKQRKNEAGDIGESVRMDFEKKMAVLKEKGLSSKELRLLAAFSNEEFYKQDQVVFLEGQKGDRLYIILDGQVRISKFIPGVGEEALAILATGDFFGEMALIDKAPRSADARAHTDVTVLPIESKLLTDILSRDLEGSYQFLDILCKMLSRRLREINMKIYHWRIMSGGF